MQTFDALWDAAASRKGGAEALEALLPPPIPLSALEETPDSRLLSAMSRRVFQAGFNCAKEHGSAARFIAATPDEEYIVLLDYFEKNGSRLGGVTLQICLRDIGKDGFILSKDVLTALQREQVIAGKGTSKRERHAAQEAFNTWRAQSQRPFAHISRILAFTV